MTEAEAKTKWCPHARVATCTETDRYGSTSPAGPVANRWQSGPHAHGGQPRFAHCVASACMAWRVSHVVRGPVVERMVAEPGSHKPDGDDWGYEGIDPRSASKGGEWVRWGSGDVHGFCGLAGRPE